MNNSGSANLYTFDIFFEKIVYNPIDIIKTEIIV